MSVPLTLLISVTRAGMPWNVAPIPMPPGAGLHPPELAGRGSLLQYAATEMDRLLDRRPTKGMMLLGLRGVGKTVVLNRLHRMADEKGIHTEDRSS